MFGIAAGRWQGYGLEGPPWVIVPTLLIEDGAGSTTPGATVEGADF